MPPWKVLRFAIPDEHLFRSPHSPTQLYTPPPEVTNFYREDAYDGDSGCESSYYDTPHYDTCAPHVDGDRGVHSTLTEYEAEPSGTYDYDQPSAAEESLRQILAKFPWLPSKSSLQTNSQEPSPSGKRKCAPVSTKAPQSVHLPGPNFDDELICSCGCDPMFPPEPYYGDVQPAPNHDSKPVHYSAFNVAVESCGDTLIAPACDTVGYATVAPAVFTPWIIHHLFNVSPAKSGEPNSRRPPVLLKNGARNDPWDNWHVKGQDTGLFKFNNPPKKSRVIKDSNFKNDRIIKDDNSKNERTPQIRIADLDIDPCGMYFTYESTMCVW